MDNYLNVTNPMPNPGWLDWYLSIRDDEGFTLPNPNGGTFFCIDQDDPFSSATLRNCQESWLYEAINPYTSRYEAITYPSDLFPYNNTRCDDFPTCHLDWLYTSINPFSDSGTFEADAYNEDTVQNICGVDYNDAESNCNTNEACPFNVCPEGLECYANVPCPGSGQPQQQPTNRPTMVSTTRVPTPEINEGCGLFFDYCRQSDPSLNQCQRFWKDCRVQLNDTYAYWEYPLPNCTDSDISEVDIVTCPKEWLYEEDNPYEVDENEACYYFFNTCREEAIGLDSNYTEYPIEFCEGNSSLTCKKDWLEQEVSPYSEESNNPDPACDRFWSHCRDQLILQYPRWYWPLPGIPTSFELMPGESSSIYICLAQCS